MDGEGTVYGQWLVESIEEEAALHTPTGKPRRIAYTVGLAAVPELP